MVVIAVLLLVVVAAVVVFVVVAGTTGTVTLEWDQLNLFFEPSPLVLFLLGAATLLLAVVAIAMLRAGSKRSMAKRRELKRLRRLEGEQGASGTRGGPRADATRADATRTDATRTDARDETDATGQDGPGGHRDAPTHPDARQVTATETRPVRPQDKERGWNEPPRG